MKLGHKLALLGKSASARSPGPEAGRAETLDALRSRMAEILGREPAPPSERAHPADTELPFLRVDAHGGHLCQRLEALRSSHHVGRMPVEAARDAEAELLALVALDPALAAVDPAGLLFLDTETTGLGGAGTVAFLVGMAGFDGQGRLEVEQLFLGNLAEEPTLLARVAARIEAASALVTFNGKSFDLPLLESRFVMNRLERPPPRAHLDLVHVARRLHKQRVGSCTLKSIEAAVLGFERGDDIDGGEVAPRYAHFLRTGDTSALRAVVDHNFWDVISMAALVGLYGEPVGVLHDADLLGLARTLKRARAFDRAAEVADRAVARGAGPEALRLRGHIAKARGDRRRALGDFEQLSRDVDDEAARLELSKLYEHFVKDPLEALAVAERGTGESAEATARRLERLRRKAARSGRR